MQCFNCHFNNMPGSVRCGRCHADLTLAATPMCVEPPRAGALEKRLFWLWWATQRRIGPVLDAVGFRRGLRPVIEVPEEAVVRPLIGMLMHPGSLVPGLPFIAAGNYAVGVALAVGWMTMLLLLVSFHGIIPIALAFASLTVALHAASAVAGTGCTFRSPGLRMGAIAACGVMLLVVCYVPTAWAAMRLITGRWVLVPVKVAVTMPPLFRGDVIWADPEGSIETGAIVLESGVRSVRRVRAMAGQEVAMKDGILTVDGVPSPWQPLTYQLPQGIRFTVPDGRVFLLEVGYAPQGRRLVPTYGLHHGDYEVPDTMIDMPRLDTISGRIIGRSYPVRRWGRID